jgi:hypothetical protein
MPGRSRMGLGAVPMMFMGCWFASNIARSFGSNFGANQQVKSSKRVFLLKGICILCLLRATRMIAGSVYPAPFVNFELCCS